MIDVFGTNCNPSQINEDKNTALMYACKNRADVAAIKIIESFGIKCKPSQINNEGNTALLLACLHPEEMREVILKLIKTFKAKCNPLQINKDSNTAFTLIEKSNIPELINEMQTVFGKKLYKISTQ